MNSNLPNSGEETDDLLSQAIAAERVGLYGQAIDLLEKFLGTQSLIERKVHASLLLGNLLAARFEASKGFPYLQEAFRRLDDQPALSASLPSDLLCEAYGTMSSLLARRKEWKKAEAFARKSLEKVGSDDSYPRYVTLGLLGDALDGGGSSVEALEVRREAVRAGEESGYGYEALWDLADTLLEAEEPDEAKEVVVRAIRSAPSRRPWVTAGILTSAALISWRLENAALAREYLREAHHYLEFDDDGVSRSKVAVQIGRVAGKCGENEVLLRIGRFLSELDDRDLRDEGMKFVVDALFEMGRNEEYISVCKKALADRELMAVDGRLGWWSAGLAGRQCAAGRYRACLRTCERGLARGGNDESVEIALRKLAIFSGCKIGRRYAVKRHASIAAEQGMFAKDPDLNEWLQENPDATRREGIVERGLRWLRLLR